MKKSVKYGLYFVVGLVAGVFVVCGVFFFLLGKYCLFSPLVSGL